MVTQEDKLLTLWIILMLLLPIACFADGISAKKIAGPLLVATGLLANSHSLTTIPLTPPWVKIDLVCFWKLLLLPMNLSTAKGAIWRGILMDF